jgi:enoyl-CoA hydratase/carnithine racemase
MLCGVPSAETNDPGRSRLLTIELDYVSTPACVSSALVSALRQLEDADGRIVLMIGQGAGLVFPGPVEDRSDRRLLAQLCDGITGHPMPVLCATEGALTDAAFDICLACDLRFASPRSWVGFPSARRGMLPVGGMTRLVACGGRSIAARVALLGEILLGERDPEPGNFLILSEDPIGAARLAGAQLADAAPLVLEALKASMRLSNGPLSAGLTVEADLAALLLPTRDRAEGVRALLERRAPTFSGE